MEGITYSLKKEESDSGNYYNNIRFFTDKVIEEGKIFLPLIDDYKLWLTQNEIESPRENEEYLLEILSFGILWQTYGHIALKVRYAPFSLMSSLAEWRKKHQKLKPFIDKLRGFLITLFLFPDKTYNIPAPPPTLKQLDHVYKWFKATGEFREQALRFINWRKFWTEKPIVKIAEIFSAIETFTFWFKENAEMQLSSYTGNVNSFIRDSHNNYRWREDRVQCMRSESEYHLNMVGAELMNRALKKQFKETLEKAVLLPGCMRHIPFTNCKAIRIPGGLKCVGCTKTCGVNKIRKIGIDKNFSVYVIPHASDLSQWSPSKQNRSLGIVASACLTTLVEGGWELKRYEIPAQCVVLDFCGCQKHWHPNGIETELNIEELSRILN